MRTTKADIWRVVHDERARLVEDLADLPSAAWTTQSLCPGWTVHDVLAHLVDSASTTRLSFVWRMMKARFDFDRDNAAGLSGCRAEDPRQTLAAMGELINATHSPPAASATRLVEAFVHGEDIRRPLGLSGKYPPDAVVVALTYQVKTSVAMGGGRERVAGQRLRATDADFDWGSGPEVSGRAIDLLLAVSGRDLL